MPAQQTILAVDDEKPILRLLEIALQAQGFRVVTARTGEDAMVQCATTRPDLMILDLGLPDMEGIDLLKRIREWSAIPVVVLTARSGEEEIVRCLDAGADDYLVKPFRTSELLARVRTALRHAPGTPASNVMVFDGVKIDFGTRRVTLEGENVHLTAIEYSLLAFLARHAGRVLTHGQILQQIWGPTFVEETQYLRVYIGQLRKKIERDPSSPKLILTETGIGYRMKDASA